jgi:deoxyribose-phosphate aldolase
VLVELACLDKDVSSKQAIQSAFVASEFEVDKLVIPVCLLDTVKEKGRFKNVSVVIDFPNGSSSTNTRIIAMSQAVKRGVRTVDVTMNHTYIKDADWGKTQKDVQTILQAAKEQGVEVRFVLDTYLFRTSPILELCKKMASVGAETIVTSTNMYTDEWQESILLAYEIQKKTPLKAICATRNFIVDDDFKLLLKKSPVHGIRLCSINALKCAYGVY